MEYKYLGRTGLKVSPLCLGTMNFGPHTSEPDSYAIMDHALEMGINFFDTANVYGQKLGEGVTEQIIGRWMAQGGGRREKVVLATKVYGGMGEWPNQSGLSALHIKQACEESLQRLQTDHIDLYQMHHVQRDTPWEEIWQAMEQLVREGKALYIGSSNFAGWHIAQANESARQRHFLGLVSEQSLYNLNDRMIEMEVGPACEHYGLGLIPWSPLAGGMLGGALKKIEEGRRAADWVQEKIDKHREQLERWESFCDELGENPADVALAWLLGQPVVTAPIIGPRTMGQLTGSARALEIQLGDEELEKLDEIWPGPGGPAPEAFAWQPADKQVNKLNQQGSQGRLQLLGQPVVTAPIIGPRTMGQLTGSARALEIQLGEEELEKLDEIWTGPGGPEPEAFAWQPVDKGFVVTAN